MRLSPWGALLLAGCAHLAPGPPATRDLSLRLSPASLGRELQLTQRVTLERGSERHAFQALLEADASVVRLAVLVLGQTVLSLAWDGVQLEQHASPRVPRAVDAARILSDLQLAWWPASAIRDALPAGASLEEAGGERRLLVDGAPVATVRYEGEGPAWAHVHLTQLELGYELDIESVQ